MLNNTDEIVNAINKGFPKQLDGMIEKTKSALKNATSEETIEGLTEKLNQLEAQK